MIFYGAVALYFLVFLISIWFKGETETSEKCTMGIVIIILAIWLFIHALFQVIALELKSLKMAMRASRAIKSFLAFYVLVWVGTFIHSAIRHDYDSDWDRIYAYDNIRMFFFPMVIHLLGAWKVKALLEEREALKFELEHDESKTV